MNEHLEGFTNNSRFFRQPAVSLSFGQQFIIKNNSCAHGSTPDMRIKNIID